MKPTNLVILRRLTLALACLAPAIAAAHPRPVAAAMVAPQLEGQININSASAEQWDLLPGIGPTTAERILAFVKKKAVTHASQLMRVKGIGRKTYDRIKPFLVVQGETTLHAADPKTQTP